MILSIKNPINRLFLEEIEDLLFTLALKTQFFSYGSSTPATMSPNVQSHPTLGYGPVEEALSHGGEHEEVDRSASGAFAEDGHVRWVAHEVLDVSLDPLQGHDHVFEGGVSWDSEGWVLQAEEAQDAQPVVYGDQDHVFGYEEVRAVDFAFAGACCESAPVDPDHDWSQVVVS